MLAFIPLAGLALGIFAARVFGRTWPMVLWLSIISMIVGAHTWFWRDVYFPSVFGDEAGALALPVLDILARLVTGPVLLAVVTAACVALGLAVEPILRRRKAKAA